MTKTNIAFIPGWGFAGSAGEILSQKLGADYHTILCDLPVLNEDSSWEDIASQLNQQLPNNCILVGWSLGGAIATHLCHQFPDKYSKLVLISHLPKFIACEKWHGVAPGIARQFSKEAKNDFANLLTKFISLVSAPDSQLLPELKTHLLSESNKSSLLIYLHKLIQCNLQSVYEQLSLPILQIFGSNDEIIPHHCAIQLTGIHPRTKTQLIHGAGHASFISHLPEFLAHLLPFIETHHE